MSGILTVFRGLISTGRKNTDDIFPEKLNKGLFCKLVDDQLCGSIFADRCIRGFLLFGNFGLNSLN